MDSNQWITFGTVFAAAIVLVGTAIEKHQERARRKAAHIVLSLASNPTNEGTTMLNINLTPAKTTDIIDISIKDAAGNITKHHGVLTVASSDSGLFDAVLNADGITATVTANTAGIIGSGTVTITDSADNIVATASVTVSDGTGEATTMELSDADSEAAALSTDAAPLLSTDPVPALSTDDVAALSTDQAAALTGGDVAQ